MLQPGYQPTHSLTVSVPSAYNRRRAPPSLIPKLFSYNLSIKGCLETPQEIARINERRKRIHSGKDIWRPERPGVGTLPIPAAPESITQKEATQRGHNSHIFQTSPEFQEVTETRARVNSQTYVRWQERIKEPASTASESSSYDGDEEFYSGAQSTIAPANPVSPPSSLFPTVEQLGHEAHILSSTHEHLEINGTKQTRSRTDIWHPRRATAGEVTASRAVESTSYGRNPKKQLYLVDIHALCYDGNRVQPGKVIEWMKLLFTQVTQADPIIAVMDGERGNEYRRALMPTYKAKRKRFQPLPGRIWTPSGSCGDLREALPLIHGFLSLCHIPVVKLEMAEADDVIATLASQGKEQGFQVVIASPDMDFRQLLSLDVHMLLPVPEFGRWSFYTLQHYVAQNQVSPDLDLGLRCLLGDTTDNIPGLPKLAPGFGRRTALMLMRKHGSLEALLSAASTRTVGKAYIQDALKNHADVLQRNLQVLRLRTDVEVALKDEWCRPRSDANDDLALELLDEQLQRLKHLRPYV